MIQKTLKNKLNKKNRISSFFAFGQTIPFALIPLVWIGVELGFQGSNLSTSVARAVIVTLAKDFISAIVYLLIITIKGKLKETIALIKSKPGILAIVAGLFGGPIGYTLFNASFLFAGPSYGHVFTSIEPIILIISSIIIFKRKFNYKVWLGVVITTFSIISLVFGSAFDQSSESIWKIIIGAIMGIGGALAWALETLFFDKAFNYMKKDSTQVATEKLLTLKLVFAVLFGFSFMIPLTAHIATGAAARGFEAFALVFKKGEYLWRFFLAGFLIMIARYMYFFAIKESGGTLVAVAYNLTIILTPIFLWLWYLISGTNLEPKTDQQWLALWITTPFIIVGITLVTLYSPKVVRQ